MPSRLLMALPLLILAGCADSLPPQVEVSGTVTFRGKPLPGGVITFVSNKGTQNSSLIDPKGHYQLKAAIGPNKISIDNRMLRKDAKAASPRLKPPTTGGVEAHPPVGLYVPMDPNYASVETSGLTYEVTPGPQTKDFSVN